MEFKRLLLMFLDSSMPLRPSNHDGYLSTWNVGDVDRILGVMRAALEAHFNTVVLRGLEGSRAGSCGC